MTKPWPDAADLSRLYDHGAAWCVNGRGHPNANDGYPDAEIHLPHDECRSRSQHVDCVGSSGVSTLELFVAQPFRFGQERTGIHESTTPSIVLSVCGSDPGFQPYQLRLTQGDALLLAHHLVSMVDHLNACSF
ncbi:MAG: hypothetical protein ACR2N4_15880 [Jatrophihabitans sp.]